MFWHILQIAWHQTQKHGSRLLEMYCSCIQTHQGLGSISFPVTQMYSFQLESAKTETPYNRNRTHLKMTEWMRN